MVALKTNTRESQWPHIHNPMGFAWFSLDIYNFWGKTLPKFRRTVFLSISLVPSSVSADVGQESLVGSHTRLTHPWAFLCSLCLQAHDDICHQLQSQFSTWICLWKWSFQDSSFGFETKPFIQFLLLSAEFIRYSLSHVMFSVMEESNYCHDCYWMWTRFHYSASQTHHLL